MLKSVFRPAVVNLYNKHMGGVDTFDQYRSYISLEMRSGKFWHPMMWFIIESALVNAWVLYSTTREKAQLPFNFTHLEFRRAIVLAVASEWESMGCGNRERVVCSPATEYAKFCAKKARRLVPTNIGDRFIAPDKHGAHCERIPLLKDSKLKQRQLLCQQCKTSHSFYWFRKCATLLCIMKCFMEFHSGATP